MHFQKFPRICPAHRYRIPDLARLDILTRFELLLSQGDIMLIDAHP